MKQWISSPLESDEPFDLQEAIDNVFNYPPEIRPEPLYILGVKQYRAVEKLMKDEKFDVHSAVAQVLFGLKL